jgi:hypothetical protein
MLFHRHPDRPAPAMVATLALLLACAWARIARADAPRLFVVDLSKEQLPAPYQDLDLAAHVGRSLAAEGCQVDRACRAEQCLKASGAASGVHLLSFQVNYDRERYACAVAVEVRDRAGGRLLYKESSSSPVCPAADLLDHTSKAARVACGELKRAPAASAPPPVQLMATPASPPPRTGQALSTAMVGLGVGSLAAGGALLYFDGSDSRCMPDMEKKRDCLMTRHTTRYAVPLFLVGAVLGGWGTYRLLGAEQRAVSVSLSPQGKALLVGGRFQ